MVTASPLRNAARDRIARAQGIAPNGPAPADRSPMGSPVLVACVHNLDGSPVEAAEGRIIDISRYATAYGVAFRDAINACAAVDLDGAPAVRLPAADGRYVCITSPGSEHDTRL